MKKEKKKSKWVWLNKNVRVKNPHLNFKMEVEYEAVEIFDDNGEKRIQMGFLGKNEKF